MDLANSTTKYYYYYYMLHIISDTMYKLINAPKTHCIAAFGATPRIIVLPLVLFIGGTLYIFYEQMN